MSRKKASHKSSFGKAVIDSLKEFISAADRGEAMTARTVKLVLEERAYSKDDIKGIRAKLGVSQAVFAQLLSISVKTVQAWESGTTKVPSIACRLFDEITANPRRWLSGRLDRISTTTRAARPGKHLIEQGNRAGM